MDENTSGADLEEAHFYHVLSEYLQLVDIHGWDYVEDKVFEMWAKENRV